MITTEQKNNAIDALIRNIGDEGVFVDEFMTLLNISQPEAQELMMELHEQGETGIEVGEGEIKIIKRTNALIIHKYSW